VFLSQFRHGLYVLLESQTPFSYPFRLSRIGARRGSGHAAALRAALRSKGSRKNNFTFCCRTTNSSAVGKMSIGNKQLWSSAALRGAAADGHLLRCRSSTMSPHRLRRGALHLPIRRSRQNVNLFLREP
jgi:hypothetical protein